MTTQEADLFARLHAADLTVDDLSRKAMRIRDRVSRLAEPQQVGMPTFSGPWTKDAIQVHLERVEEWVRTPTRAANRCRLEALGVRGAAIKPEVLDDTEFLDEVLRDVEEISAACPFVKPCLVEDDCLPAWLSRGPAEARQKILSMKGGLEGYKRLHAFPLAARHQDELLKVAVANPDTLAGAQVTAKQIESVQQYGIAVPASEAVTTFEATLLTLGEGLRTLQSRFPERLDLLRPSFQDQTMADAQKAVAAEVDRCEKEYNALLSEWQRLERTLRLLGIGHPGAIPPRTLAGMEEQIAEFRKQCSTKVGEEGMSLLSFLQGDTDFPAGLTLEAVRDALLSLRPLVVISSRTGVYDAKG
ncbi:MAG: hypothetical protein NTX87_15870 [Planctomycetota bacterium]|nr:hypothetical protein [Planctomycetota bacterium]